MVTPDGNNINSVRAFLNENKYLTNVELAILANRSIETIRAWKRKCGVVMERPAHFQPKRWQPRTQERCTDKSIWNTREWFYDQYHNKGRGVRTIARIIGRTNDFVYMKLKKFKIETRNYGNSSTNECCNREWLEEHYIVLGYSLRACAKLAGVNSYTIYRWFAKFGIVPRTIKESQIGERSCRYGQMVGSPS